MFWYVFPFWKMTIFLQEIYLLTGLKKVPISPWLVTLLHICGVIPTPNITRNSVPISPATPHEHLYCHVERQSRYANRRCLCIERQYHQVEWRVFHDVSQCFKSFMMFYQGSSCFTSGYDVLQCFTIFNNVFQCLVSCATIGIRDRAATDRLRGRQNSAEIGDEAAGIINITAKVIPC